MALDLTLLLLGLGAGAAIALTALGLVLMYRSSGVLNFATGGVGMTCSYVFWELTREHGWSAWAGGAASVLLGGALGAVSYALVIVLPRRSSNLMRVMGTLGVLVICQAAVQLRYGPTPLVVDDFLPSGSLDFGGGVAVPWSRVSIVGTSVVLTIVLALVYGRTTFGLATTAASESPRKLAAFGWRIGMVGSVNWTVGGALAGLAGVLLAPITGVALTNGTSLTVTVLAAALIGGLRSFSLTLAGGMLIGMLQSLMVVHDLGVDGLADAVPFLVIVVVIVVRGRALPLRSHVGERLPRVGTGLVSLPGLAGAVALGALLVGPLLDDDGTAAVTTSLLAAILLMSYTVVLGYAGQMSLAQVTLGGVGGLIAARLTSDLGWPFPLVLLAGMLGTVPVGVLVGLPSARTRGVSLAVATLGLAVAIQSLVFDNDRISGGQNGVRLSLDGSLELFGVDVGSFSHPERYAYLVLGIAVVLGSAVAALRRGASGRRMIAVRNNERAAAGLGIDVVTTKLWAFGLASAIAGVAGVLTAFRGPAALFSQQSVLSNIVSVGYAVVGGVGSVIGAVFGSTLEPGGAGNQALGWIVGVGPVTMSLIGGVLLILTIVGSPDGMGPAASDALGRLRARRRAAASARRLERYLATGPVDAVGVRRAALHLHGVSVRFAAVQAVADVDLSVAPGEIVGVVGANGAGKTTLIDAVTGFVPSTGRVVIDGRDIGGRPAHVRARLGVGRSWQSLELIEDLTVLDNLRAAADVHRWWSVLADLVRPGRDRPSAAMLRAIDTLDLREHLSAMPGELSTGRRKLVALARAIVNEPSVVLLDEPCSGLDQDERDEVGDVVRMLAREWGMGVLLVEHDVQLVRRLSDRIVALDAGRVVAEGPADHVLRDPRVVAAFLGEVDETDRTSDQDVTDLTPAAPPVAEVAP